RRDRVRGVALGARVLALAVAVAATEAREDLHRDDRRAAGDAGEILAAPGRDSGDVRAVLTGLGCVGTRDRGAAADLRQGAVRAAAVGREARLRDHLAGEERVVGVDARVEDRDRPTAAVV